MKKSICALAILAGAASTALADSVKLDYKGQNGKTVNVSGRGNVNAGYMDFEVKVGGTSTQFTAGDHIRTFCIDLTRTLIDPDLYEIKSLGGVVPTISIEEQAALANMFAHAVANGYDFTNNETGSTFQLAIWEVLTDLDLTAGNGGKDSLDVKADAFKLGSSGFQGTSTMLDDLFEAAINGSANPNIILHGLDAVSGAQGQDQMYFTVIPLPTSAGLAAVGLLGVATIRRRRMA